MSIVDIDAEQNNQSFAVDSQSNNYFLVGRGGEKSILLNETSGNSYAFSNVPTLPSVHYLFKNNKIHFNGIFSYEINEFFQCSIDNTRTLYSIRDLKFAKACGGGTELIPFFGYALRIVVEAPIELGTDTKTAEDDDQQQKQFGSGKTEKEAEIIFEKDSEEAQAETFKDEPFFEFVKAIVSNFLDLGTERFRHGRRFTGGEAAAHGGNKRAKFCAKLRLKVGKGWRLEEHLFEELANNNTGEVLRIFQVPIAEDDDQSEEGKLVLIDVFILRCARDEMGPIPTDLNALFAPDKFDCQVIAVEKPSEKIAKYI
ncbi:hypothetical protein niasHT_020676 [Heterodera trifolii]|uniref:Uncharacterized protein n=1 Tax=Heterodera trifolii TaxID=157864 RepID=A0ABD2JZR7_9BILA